MTLSRLPSPSYNSPLARLGLAAESPEAPSPVWRNPDGAFSLPVAGKLTSALSLRFGTPSGSLAHSCTLHEGTEIEENGFCLGDPLMELTFLMIST